MAPSANRRSGNSRRAQYTTFFAYIAGGIGAGLGAIFLLVSLNNPGFMSGLRGLGADATAPVANAAAASKVRSESFFDAISGYFQAGSQNARLKRELAEAKLRLVSAAAKEEENRRLKGLLGIMEAEPKPVVASRLIGSSASSTRRFATLAAGTRQGVGVGMPVRSSKGIVGRVLEVSGSTARVLLITDSESVVPVRRASDGIPAFAEGRGDGALQIRLINLGINPLKPGDAFVTSGSGGLYRPGIPIAVVWKVTSDGAIARVLSDPAASDYVVVERQWSEDPASDNQADETAADKTASAAP